MEPEANLDCENARSRRAARTALLSVCFLLAACMTPVCDALVWECPAMDPGPDAGPAPDGNAAQDGGVVPDSGNEPDAATAPDTAAKCVPGSWEFETVASLNRDGWPRAVPDFMIDDDDDEVHLTYTDSTSRYYVRRSRAGWSAPVLLGGQFLSPPSGALALTSTEQVQTVWGDSLGQAGPLAFAERLPWGEWVRTNLGQCPKYGCADPRLAIDASGVSHVAFVVSWDDGTRYFHPRLNYLFRVPGEIWSQQELVEHVDAFEVALAVGADGPHLAYVDAENLVLKHATRVDGAWRIEAIRENMPNYILPTLTVDEGGGIHIAYLQNVGFDFSHAYAHRPAGGEWAHEEVGTKPGSRLASPSVTTRSGQTLLALQTETSVSVSRRTETGWQTEKVASLADDTNSWDVGPVLRVDARGGLHVVYPDWGSGTLVYARQCRVP